MPSRSHSSSSHRRGFAAMPKSQVRRIAAMGGRASHGGTSDYDDDDRSSSRSGRGSRYEEDDDRNYRSQSSGRYEDDDRRMSSRGGWDEDEDDRGGYQTRGDYDESDYDEDSSDSDYRSGGRGRQGFASMDEDEQRRIASMGGRASHGGRGRSSSRDYDDDYDDNRRRSSNRGSSRSNSRNY